nr:Coenzyme F420 hydrogenase/dehydrogenase, beta subunit C-terminal domain [Bacteroidota bacterium]
MKISRELSFDQLFGRVISQGLCVRCGICAGVCPVNAIGFDGSKYPRLTGKCIVCDFCNACCPGGDVDFPALSQQLHGVDYDPSSLQGFVEHMYVSHATNSNVRDSGTSGGVVTALLLHLLESGKIEGAIVVGADTEQPYLSKGILATKSVEIVAAAKSKYQITPSMEVLQILREREGRFAVVGLPCQIHGLKKLGKADPVLYAKIYCSFGLFCHCNLEQDAVTDAIDVRGIRLADVDRFEYRGGDWPGRFMITKKKGTRIPLFSIYFANVINVLFRLYGAKRCRLCVDALAEFADLSFGDFWANDYQGNLAGMEKCTLVFQRSKVGASILHDAGVDGAINLQSLPEERASKRILNMAREKKQQAHALLWSKSKRGEQYPNYHLGIHKPSISARRSLLMFRLYNFLRKAPLRKFVLILLFSPAGKVFDYMNLKRKKWFSNFYGN